MQPSLLQKEKAKLVHETAMIHPNAKIGVGVQIGAWSVIEADVEIGDHTSIDHHVVIKGPTKIGQHNKIFQFCSLGEEPQVRNYSGESTCLEVGDHNYIREFCTLNRGTINGGGVTRIGSHNFLMAYVHIAHDCIVGSHITFANNAALSGHVTVDDHVGFGGFSAAHQFCRIGRYAFVAGATSVVKDVPPFVLVSGHPARVYGLNTVGLRRHEFNDLQISALKTAYDIVYRRGYTVERAIQELEKILEAHPEIHFWIESLQKSERGIVR